MPITPWTFGPEEGAGSAFDQRDLHTREALAAAAGEIGPEDPVRILGAGLADARVIDTPPEITTMPAPAEPGMDADRPAAPVNRADRRRTRELTFTQEVAPVDGAVSTSRSYVGKGRWCEHHQTFHPVGKARQDRKHQGRVTR